MAVAYLLEARVVVTTNDDHLRLLLTSPLVGTVAKVYSDLEVGIVMESFHQQSPHTYLFWRLHYLAQPVLCSPAAIPLIVAPRA